MQASFETQLTDLKRLINIERPLRDNLHPDYNFRNLYGYSLLELAIIEGDIPLCAFGFSKKAVFSWFDR